MYILYIYIHRWYGGISYRRCFFCEQQSLCSGKRCWREIAEIAFWRLQSWAVRKKQQNCADAEMWRCGDGNDCILYDEICLPDMTRCGRCLPRIEKVEAKVACGVSSKKCNAVLHERQVVSGLRQAEASMRCKCSRSNLIETWIKHWRI